MNPNKYITLDMNLAKLERVKRELVILKSPGFTVIGINGRDRNIRARKHRYLVRHVESSYKRLLKVVEKQKNI